MVGVFAVGLVFILLIIALIVYFWYIILPAIVVIVVIYILRNRKPRIKKTSSCWETLPKEEPSEDSRQTNHRQTYKSKYTRSVEKLEKLQNAMLKKFNLAEFEAKLVFGEKWKNILAKKNTQDEKLVNSILKIQTKIMFDLDYREKVIRIADKLIQMIDSVISDNPEIYEKYTNDMGQYEKIYKHQWKFFKKHKKTAFEEAENELDELEAYEILNLDITATFAQVKRRYRELVKKWHPDKNKTSLKTEAEKKLVRINQAYERIERKMLVA